MSVAETDVGRQGCRPNPHAGMRALRCSAGILACGFTELPSSVFRVGVFKLTLSDEKRARHRFGLAILSAQLVGQAANRGVDQNDRCHSRVNHSRSSSIVVRRFPVSELLEIFNCEKPMPPDLAATIRLLRTQHSIGYADLAFYLAESDPPYGLSVGLGKGLAELAERDYPQEGKSTV